MEDLKKAKETLEKLIQENPNIIKEEEWKVFVDSLGDSAVILGMRAWVKTDEYWPTRWKSEYYQRGRMEGICRFSW